MGIKGRRENGKGGKRKVKGVKGEGLRLGKRGG